MKLKTEKPYKQSKSMKPKLFPYDNLIKSITSSKTYKEKEKTKMTSIRNERGDIITETAYIN